MPTFVYLRMNVLLVAGSLVVFQASKTQNSKSNSSVSLPKFLPYFAVDTTSRDQVLFYPTGCSHLKQESQMPFAVETLELVGLSEKQSNRRYMWLT